MKNSILEIEENRQIAPGVYRAVLRGEGAGLHRPGQFINIALDGFYLRRPISVYDADPESDSLSIIYKVVGRGTGALAGIRLGAGLDCLLGLGNGFDLSAAGSFNAVIGGGVGVPPMYFTAKYLANAGKKVCAVIGFNKKNEIICREDFESLGIETLVCTGDGSYGIRGFVTDGLTELQDPDYYYACGPEPMLKAVWNTLDCDGELSFEERMGCGFGACMGCTCKTKYKDKRICKDGPVLKKGEIVW